jgi:hypothetical protein
MALIMLCLCLVPVIRLTGTKPSSQLIAEVPAETGWKTIAPAGASAQGTALSAFDDSSLSTKLVQIQSETVDRFP